MTGHYDDDFVEDEDEEEGNPLNIYAPDPINLGKFLLVGRHKMLSHFREGLCDYCGTVYFERSNCPNCGAPRRE